MNRAAAILLILLFYVASPQADTALHQLKMTRCMGGNFYCLRIGGAAFRYPNKTRVDTGNGSLSVPEACLKNGSYKIILANAKDPWGNEANIVEANVSLLDDNNQSIITVKKLRFYALTQGSCRDGFSNFGISIGTDRVKNCLLNYFIQAAYTASSPSYLVSIQPTHDPDQSLMLSFGRLPIPTSKPYIFTKVYANCQGYKKIPSFINPIDKNWHEVILPNFTMHIQNVAIPATVTNSNSKSAMIDSGGGMVIMYDDNQHSILNKLSASVAINPFLCDSKIFLVGCSCLAPNYTIYVTSKRGVRYSYESTGVDTDQRSALAVCPAPYRDNPDPYVETNGVNLGYEFFQHNELTLDFRHGNVWVTPNP